jgi:hypothetical protein
MIAKETSSPKKYKKKHKQPKSIIDTDSISKIYFTLCKEYKMITNI